MGFSLLSHNTRELWKEWELRSLVLLSLFLQLTLATLVNRRKFNSRHKFQIIVWIMYLLANSIATFTLSVLSNRVVNIKETKGTTDPKSQITAFWAPFLLLHLGGPDTITAYVLEDNELWLKQLAQLCVQAGLTCFIYLMALSGSTLSVLAVGMILVGFIKHAERILCLYLASKGPLRDSMLSLPDFSPMNAGRMKQYTLKKEEGYQVGIEQVKEFPARINFPVISCQTYNEGEDKTLVEAYESFKVFKLLFLGLIRYLGVLNASKRMFMGPCMTPEKAFKIVEIELSCMYDLLFTKVPLLNGAWGIIRWVISLLVPCAVCVFFSLQDKEDYPKVDIWITFLLISVAILLDIYSLLQTISSDLFRHWQLQRPKRSANWSDVLRLHPNQRWSKSVAQYRLLTLSIRRMNTIFRKHPRLTKLDQRLEKKFYIYYREFSPAIKDWIFHQMRETVTRLEQTGGLKSRLVSLKLAVSEVLVRSNCLETIWSVQEMEFDQSILIWHVATELCYYEDRFYDDSKKKNYEDIRELSGKPIAGLNMSQLVSRYMLYLMLLHPSMLPTGIGVLRYEDTSIDIQKFLENKRAVLSKNDGSMLIKPRLKLSKNQEHRHNGACYCKKVHNSRESRDRCEVCHLLLQVKTDLTERNMWRSKNRSVLSDACHLASKLREHPYKWDVISEVWTMVLMYTAFQSKGYEHCGRLSSGGELLSHVWLLMAHFGIVEAVQTSEAQCITKLIVQ